MCGIVGRWRFGGAPDDGWLDVATDRLAHRGPDDRGTWRDGEVGVELGHRRLSIIDLTPGGHQPMTSASGRYVLVFNGEVYDHRDLRHELEGAGVRFRGTSDTEVLLEGIDRWGLRRTLERIDAMFALALWDRREGRLALARDRLGEKPLFVAASAKEVRFASEMKAWWVGSVRPPAVDRAALAAFLRYGYVPQPHAIFEGVTKLAPGTIRWFDGASVRDESYWSLPPLEHGPVGEAEQRELVELLAGSVARRVVADVPVGAFLSGGIDSSLIVALMARASPAVRTFTIGFDDAAFDESAHARRIASHLGTDHTELRVTGADALDVVPTLYEVFDEPFADRSAIPTALVARLTRDHVTVALSGDGGDELFGGYDRYRRLRRAALAALAPRWMGHGLEAIASAAAARGASPGRARTVERLGAGIAAGGGAGLYRSLVSLWERPSDLVGPGEVRPEPVVTGRWPVGRDDLVRTAMAADLRGYLPDDILAKVDRTSMAVGLEVRVPLLDHRVVAWSRRYARPGTGMSAVSKAPLREALAAHVPPALWDRPKQGFGAPVGTWLRGPLRPWSEDLLSVTALEASGLAPTPIRRRWAEHLTGRMDHTFPLWAVLSYQAWRERWLP
ncbi:MAG: asparagine synthase (glutamine-hydrolyzing) [Acidimicrobiales bacterium]|nr:asparagine synthase (glutamine-hydrolyzing) [Acidimicrobiales bacterium]